MGEIIRCNGIGIVGVTVNIAARCFLVIVTINRNKLTNWHQDPRV